MEKRASNEAPEDSGRERRSALDEGSAANRSFEGGPDDMINEVYKQDMVLCARCSSLLSYRSMLVEEQESCGVFSRL